MWSTCISNILSKTHNVDQINTGKCAFIVKPQTTRIQVINLSGCNQKKFELGCFFLPD